MEPLICPQCGGSIIDYSTERNFANCGYCSTRFLISSAKHAAESEEPAFGSSESTGPAPQAIFLTIGLVALFIGVAVFLGFITSLKEPSRSVAVSPPRPTFTPSTPKASPAATAEPNLLTFGGKGTGDGLFTDASAIAVDRSGRIYVGDGTLRVQQFDEKGGLLKVWQIPDRGPNYTRARSVNKLAVDRNGKLYVGVGGVILVYDQKSDAPLKTIQVAPDFIQDIAVRSDQGLLMVSHSDATETLSFLDQNGRITRRLSSFHSDASDAQMSPHETGLAAIRIAVDGAGNIFSVYAFGALGSYELSYADEDMKIFRFAPSGKYVDKFGFSMSSCGIAVDDQSRIYITEGDMIRVFRNNGDFVNDIIGLNSIDAFALDAENNLYALLDDVVVKRPPVP
jgi:sugar lactone lactonase YvrE